MEERTWLKEKCSYFNDNYLEYLAKFRFRPAEQVLLSFSGGEDDDDYGDLEIEIKGTWAETILYEIPLLALTSEAFFRLVEKEWNHEGQEGRNFSDGNQEA